MGLDVSNRLRVAAPGSVAGVSDDPLKVGLGFACMERGHASRRGRKKGRVAPSTGVDGFTVHDDDCQRK